jgi:hypothetical protein
MVSVRLRLWIEYELQASGKNPALSRLIPGVGAYYREIGGDLFLS